MKRRELTESEIRDLTQQFVRRREIDDALVPYFNQRGKWIGDGFAWPYHVWFSAKLAMQGAWLEPSRRVRRCRAGTVLRTSYVWTAGSPLVIRFAGLEGSLLMTSNTSMDAPHLQRLGGHLITETKARIDLPVLTDVGGHFDAPACDDLNASQLARVGGRVRVNRRALPALVTVMGDYQIRWAFDIDAPHLRQVGGSWILHKCTSINAPKLESVGANLLTGVTTRMLNLPCLRMVGGDLLAGAAEEIRAPWLRSVGGTLDTQSASDYYHPKIHCGKWHCHPDAMRSWNLRETIKKAILGDPSWEI